MSKCQTMNTDVSHIINFPQANVNHVDAVYDKLLRNSEDFVWPIDSSFHGRFIIDVEFLDLKIATMNVRNTCFFLCIFLECYNICILFGSDNSI